jgi:hypothetical protein
MIGAKSRLYFGQIFFNVFQWRHSKIKRKIIIESTKFAFMMSAAGSDFN